MKKKAKGVITVIAILLIICLAIINSSWMKIRYTPIKQLTGVNKEKFLSKMEKLDEIYNSKVFSENGELLFETAQEYQYNEYLLPALMCLETNGGTSIKGTFNYWNAVNSPMEFTNFETSEDCIETFFMVLDACYSEATIKEFANKWTPDTTDEFAKTVYQMSKKIENL